MTTPDKEEIPKDRTAGPWIVHYGEAVKIKDANGYTVASLSQIHLHGRRSKNEVEKTAQFIVTACNAYEPMREALILAEKADRIHSKCQECEDGAQAPEACGDCFPSADDARVARRNVLKSLGVRMRDVDRARAIKAEPSICNCSQEDVHDYGPCGEDCRSLVVSTLPVNDRQTSDDVGILREALANLVKFATLVIETKFDRYKMRNGREAGIEADDGEKCWIVHSDQMSTLEGALDNARAALKGVPQPASEADAFDLEAFIEGDNLEPGKLRPCPFCGGEAERIDFDEDDDEPENVGGSAITCKRCKCSTAVVFGYKETLVSSWNERAPANAQPASEAGKLSTDTDAAN